MSRQLKPHGTHAAYERHRRRGERPCEPCRLSHLARANEYQRRTGRNNARQRAMLALARRHRDTFAALRTQAKADDFGDPHNASRRIYQAALRELARLMDEEFAELMEAEMAKGAER